MKTKLIIAIVAATFSVSANAIDVYFSPNGGAAAALIKEIDAAMVDIHVMTYQMTNKGIAEALLRAKQRGVALSIIVDKSQRKAGLEGAQYCCAADVASKTPVLLDAKHPIHHNKVAIIDHATVVTGSFNFSNAADKANAENMLVIRDVALAGKYLNTWNIHAAHSEKY